MTDRDTDSLSLLTSQAAVALRNANALAKEERLRRRAESLVEATTALTSTLELEQLLENILRAAARSIPAAEKGSILLQEAESSSLTMRALIGYDDPRVREVSFAKSEGYSAEVAEKGKPVIVRDARAAPFCYEGEIAEMRAVQSAVAVPLVYKEKTIGVLALDNAHRKNAFAEKDLNLLSAFADQAAMAIENARLFEQHGRRITELSIINEIGRAVSAAFDRDALFQTLREQISRVFDITNFYLATYDVARSEWCSVVHFEHGKEQPLGTYEAGSGLTGFIIRSRKPILLRSREENLAFKKTQGIEAIGELAGSWLGVPLRVGEQVIGVMGVQDYEEEGRYDENDLVVFSTIASQVAIALANLYLLEESQERAKELELINDVGKTVASILDLRQVFRAIVDATKSRFGFFFVGILGIEQGKVVLLDGSTIGRSRNRLGQGILISDAKGERGLVAAAIRSKKEVLVNDVHNDGRYIEYSKLEATQSELCVPILMQDRVIGAFDVQSDRTDAFDDRSVGLLQALASHAGVAIENARLYESVRQELAERKRTERALRESEHRYREVVENAEDIIYTCDINGNYLFVNEAGRQVSGYSHEELKGMNYLELIVTEHRRRVQIHYMRQFLSKEPTSYVEYPFLTKAGEVVWLAQNASIMMTEGEVVGFHIYARNITERLQAEAALQRERETFYSILESAPYGVVLLDGRIIGYLNPAFTSISGYTIADIQTTDQYFERCFGRSVLRDEIEKHSNKQANAAPHEVYSLTASDGSTKNVEVTWATLEDGRVLMMLDDVTERQRLESRLREAQRLEAVGRLAGGIAHDFNNILTAITGYADFVLTGLEEVDPLSNDVIEIRKAAKRASKLTSQLLAFSRRQMLQVKIVDLNVLIADMQNMLRRLIGEDVELRADLASHLHQVKADPGQIEQVVMNLIVNAREAMPDGGQITVGTENVEQTEEFGQIDSETRTGRFVRVFVEDTGTGMDQETAKQVFEPFFSTKEAGTGLGLSVVYGIVKQHGGWIEVESEIGCGSIFRMYLPAVLSKPTTVERPVSETAASRGGTERILLVEDEQGVRRFVSRVLGRNGYHVDAVSTVAEAIKLFEHNEGEFDLLLSDVVLPDRSGVELADHLLSQKPNIRILLSSGYSDQKSQWPRIQEKGYRFLQKPYDLSVLLATVRDVLEADSLPRSSLGH